MNKQEAIQAMTEGKKVAHRYFANNEWVTMDADGKIVTEEGYKVSHLLFWMDRTDKAWDEDWEVVEEDAMSLQVVLEDKFCKWYNGIALQDLKGKDIFQWFIDNYKPVIKLDKAKLLKLVEEKYRNAGTFKEAHTVCGNITNAIMDIIEQSITTQTPSETTITTKHDYQELKAIELNTDTARKLIREKIRRDICAWLHIPETQTSRNGCKIEDMVNIIEGYYGISEDFKDLKWIKGDKPEKAGVYYVYEDGEVYIRNFGIGAGTELHWILENISDHIGNITHYQLKQNEEAPKPPKQ